MAYQSLYRKYRSKDFADLIGQRHVTQTLANAISSGRVAHAYLFCGPRGTGKTSTARVLAKALNCVHGPTMTPCDTCEHCRSIRQGSAIDVIEIDAASNRNIDDIRQLREQVNYPPVALRYKFYIVDEVHQLTRDSFNAFLKTLEEPPAHVVFVLCTTDPHQLPATILSRCQRFDFHRITLDEIVERMRWIAEQEGWRVDDEALALVARTANGGMRDALSLLDQAASYAGTHITGQHVRDILGGIDLDLLLAYTDHILQRDADGLFRLIERIMAEGKDVPQLVAELIQHWRNLLRATIGGAEALVDLTPEQRRQLATQARQSELATIMRNITLLCEAENELRWNSQQRLLLELYSLRLMAALEAPAPAAPPRAEQPEGKPAPRPPQRAEAELPVREPQPVAPVKAAEKPAPVESGAWTRPRLQAAWPEFIASMARNPKLENLRTRIVEKCWPANITGDNILTLGTSSSFTRSMVYDRPQVKQALEQCLQSHFKAKFIVKVEVLQENGSPAPDAAAPAPAPKPAPTPATAAPAAEPTPPADPNRDIVSERMKEVFTGAEEIGE